MKPIFRLLGLAAVLMCIGASAPARNWNATVTLTPGGGHLLGNPAAKVRLTEYISYTCPHCADFEVQSEAPLRLAYVAPGKLAIEVRHMIRDPIDMTVAMLTNCGDPAKFFLNHAALMRGQSKWIAPLAHPSEAQLARWQTGDTLASFRNIANDFKLYDVMATRGYDRLTVDRCLSDKAMAERLAAQQADAIKLGVENTPSFAINGDLLFATHDWSLLEPQLAARF